MRIFLVTVLLAFTTVATAEDYEVRPSVLLKSLADDAKTGRKVTGGLLMGLGVLTTALLLGDDETEYPEDEISNGDALFVGGILVGIGALPFFIESRPERAWNSVQQEANTEEREHIAYSSLIDLAEQYRYSRLLGGTLNLALATYFLTRPTERQYDSYGYTERDYSINAVIHGIFGAYNLIVPSRAERVVKRLQTGDDYRHNMASASFTVGLNGNWRYPGLALRYTF